MQRTTLHVGASAAEATPRQVILTLNGMGTMQETVDPFCRRFVDDAIANRHWVLDVGCAFGIHTIAAITGGARVIANDMERGHLEYLQAALPTDQNQQLRTCEGRFPDVTLPVTEPLGAILAARLLHFCDGPTIERMAARMFELLVPGGRVYAIALTPYAAQLFDFLPLYLGRRRRNEPFPGLVEDLSLYDAKNVEAGRLPKLMHFLDPEVLRRVFAGVGFEVEFAEYVANGTQAQLAGATSRALAGIIARKPLPSG